LKLPALFVGHGSPMNAIEDNAFRRTWRTTAARIPKPESVLCISAHWETEGVAITAAGRPETIHDFHGFPQALAEFQYPAPGRPALARRVAELLAPEPVTLDEARGLDHGCWSVLASMYPAADVPVVQLSLNSRQPAAEHYRLARGLAPLREENVLVLCTGNIVHNLRRLEWNRADGAGWAERFDAEVRRRVLARDHQSLIDYRNLTPEAHLAVPSPEHYWPLLYALATQEEGEAVTFFNEQTVMGSISMTSVIVGSAPAPGNEISLIS